MNQPELCMAQREWERIAGGRSSFLMLQCRLQVSSYFTLGRSSIPVDCVEASYSQVSRNRNNYYYFYFNWFFEVLSKYTIVRRTSLLSSCCSQRKNINIEHWAGKAARLAGWVLLVMVSLESFPFPRNETLESLSTLTSWILHPPSRVKSRAAGRGQWGMAVVRRLVAQRSSYTNGGSRNTYTPKRNLIL